MAEQLKMGWETSFGKIINWTIFCAPNSNWSAGWFGQFFQHCNVPRSEARFFLSQRLLVS